MNARTSLVFGLAAGLGVAVTACGTPPEPPSTGALAMPPAHPSPDPPPGRPLFIEARDAASDAEAGVGAGVGAGFGGAAIDGDGGVGGDAGALLDGVVSDGGAAASIAGADRVVAGLRPRFRNCYKLGLATDPKMQGRVNLATSVSPKGDVVAVTATQIAGMNPRVVACVVSVMQKAKFTAPGGTGSSVQIPIAFR